ncbi:unnamed protein product, partial [marine sediment metagenome]
MKVIILTTDTLHHTYFIQEIAKIFPIAGITVETHSRQAPFDTYHPFEKDRDLYEKGVFFGNDDVKLSDFASTLAVKSINGNDATEHLRRIRPDIVIVFGTGKIKQHVIDVCPEGFINLHGGNSEEYRGLDSHLWAIYHNDFNNIITTLHRLNEKLDDGDIILQSTIPLKRGMGIHEIRRYNTEVCVELTFSAIDMFRRFGHFISRPQC